MSTEPHPLDDAETWRAWIEEKLRGLGSDTVVPVPVGTLRALLAGSAPADPNGVEPLVCVFCVIDLKDAERRSVPEADRLPVHAARVVANGMTMCDVRHVVQPPPVSNGFLLPGNGQQLPPINGFAS